LHKILFNLKKKKFFFCFAKKKNDDDDYFLFVLSYIIMNELSEKIIRVMIIIF